MSIPYIDYKTLEEFYTLSEVCKLLQLDKTTLRQKCEAYDIKPRQNEIGDWGLVKYDIRKLHNQLYHENRYDKKEEDPWA